MNRRQLILGTATALAQPAMPYPTFREPLRMMIRGQLREAIVFAECKVYLPGESEPRLAHWDQESASFRLPYGLEALTVERYEVLRWYGTAEAA